MSNNRLFGFWKDLTPALRTGMPQNEAKTGEEPFFTVLYADPRRLKEFLRAMSGLSRPANLAIARQLPWENYATYVDVGTAQGDLVVQIALEHSHLTGIGFDLPEVGPVFEEYIRETRLAGRVRFIGGNFFTDPLPKADVVLMGHILHDWNLEEKMMLLAKAYEALPDDGAVVIYDSVIDDDRSKNSFGLLMSLNMLIETPGGFDYTGGRGVDAPSRLSPNSRRTPGRAGFDGRGHQVEPHAAREILLSSFLSMREVEAARMPGPTDGVSDAHRFRGSRKDGVPKTRSIVSGWSSLAATVSPPGMLDYARPDPFPDRSQSCHPLDISWIWLAGRSRTELTANPSKDD